MERINNEDFVFRFGLTNKDVNYIDLSEDNIHQSIVNASILNLMDFLEFYDKEDKKIIIKGFSFQNSDKIYKITEPIFKEEKWKDI